MTPADARLWIVQFLHDSAARARDGLPAFKPVVRGLIEAGEAWSVAMVDELYDKYYPLPQGVFPMAAAANKPALMAAGVPAEHCDAAAALGVTPDQAKQMTAMGFDIAKFLQALPQLFALFMSFFGGTAGPTLPTGAGTPPPTSPK